MVFLPDDLDPEVSVVEESTPPRVRSGSLAGPTSALFS